MQRVDTDVIVIAIAMLRLLFGTGSNLRYIPVHEVVAEMEHRFCATLPMFHSLTGCDTVSSFCGRGKKNA